MCFPVKIQRIDNSEGVISKDFSMLLKGLCCILVGLHHYARIAVEQDGSTNVLYILLASQGGNIGVGLFFFLSGYGIMESAKKRLPTVKEVLVNRYWKLLWPILTLNILYLIIAGARNPVDSSDLHSLMSSIVDFKSVDPVLWFIEVLFACYAAFYISIRFDNARRRDCLMYGMGCLLIVFFMLTRNELHWHYTNIPMFFLGIYYSQHRSNLSKKCTWGHVLILCALILTATGIGWFLFHLMWARLGVCLIVLLPMLVITRSHEITTIGKSFLGKISYEYYLSHNKILMLSGG